MKRKNIAYVALYYQNRREKLYIFIIIIILLCRLTTRSPKTMRELYDSIVQGNIVL